MAYMVSDMFPTDESDISFNDSIEASDNILCTATSDDVLTDKFFHSSIATIPAFYNREEIDVMMKKMQDEIDVLKSGNRGYRINESMEELDFIHEDPYDGYITLSRDDIDTLEELEDAEEFPDILPGELDDDLEELPKSMDVGPELIDVTAEDDDDLIDFDCIIDEDD